MIGSIHFRIRRWYCGSVMSSPPPSRSPTLPRQFLLACGAAVLATAGFAAWLAWQIGGEKTVLYVSDTGTVLTPLIAGVACIRAGKRHEGRSRLFWRLLAAACISWMLGEMIWTAYDFSGAGGPPIPSAADVGYLAFIPLSIAALLRHPGLRSRGTRIARSLIDGVAIAVALLFLSWTFVLGPLWRSSDLTTLGDTVTLAYPCGDVVLGFFVILVLRRVGPADRLGLWCLLAGLIALALADSTFAYVVQVKHYTTGNLLDTGWFAGFLGIALGALATKLRDPPLQAESSLLALPSLVAPLLPMLVALIVAGITIRPDHSPDWVAVTMVFVLVLLALLRQTLLVFDFVTTGRGERSGGVIDRIARAALGSGMFERPRETPRGPEGPEGSEHDPS